MVTNWIETADLDDPTSPYAEYAIDSATFIVWALSGRKYSGVRTTTENYVCPSQEPPIGCTWLNDTAYRDSQGRINHVLRLLGDTGVGNTKIPLRHSPVREIVSVVVNDEPIDETTYFLENNKYLVLDASIPSCSGIEVEYRHGRNPPSMGKLAVITLANNIAADLEGKDCALPSNVTSLTRQGVSMEIYNPDNMFENGFTGIFIVDAFIAAVNPAKAKKPSKIFSAGNPAGRHRKHNY